MTFEELESKVLDWADGHDLLHEENAGKQFMKFIEEVFEFKTEMDYASISGGNPYLRNMEFEMGDVFVTLIILCKQIGIDPVECLEIAYKMIKDRKGKIVVGKFIKAEDLEK